MLPQQRSRQPEQAVLLEVENTRQGRQAMEEILLQQGKTWKVHTGLPQKLPIFGHVFYEINFDPEDPGFLFTLGIMVHSKQATI